MALPLGAPSHRDAVTWGDEDCLRPTAEAFTVALLLGALSHLEPLLCGEKSRPRLGAGASTVTELPETPSPEDAVDVP